jgi:protein SCO1/2
MSDLSGKRTRIRLHNVGASACKPERFAAVLATGVALMLLVGCGSSGKPAATTALPAKHGSLSSTGVGRSVPAGTVAADFALRDQHGDIVRLSDERGKITLLTFLYTHCVDVCPLIAEELNAVLRDLGPARNEARVLAVSVDPRFDTPEAITHFVAAHRLLPEFQYLRGTAAQLKLVWQAYNVLVIPKNPDLMAHTASITLIDRQGEPRLVYPATATAAEILRDAKRLLRG